MSKRVETAVGLGIAVIVVQTITVPVNNLIFNAISGRRRLGLGRPAGGRPDLSEAGLLHRRDRRDGANPRNGPRSLAPALYRALGIFLPLITVNCAILGGSLFMVERRYDFTEALTYGFGSGVGWALAIITFAAIRERLKYTDMPEGVQGLARRSSSPA